MCTAISYTNNDHYFGRNLDLDYSFNEKVCITPRDYPFLLKNGTLFKNAYAIIGMATVTNGYPLYAEAANEKGLCMAGLNYPDHDMYKTQDDKMPIAQFEFIPYILGKCQSVKEAREVLKTITLSDIPFSEGLPITILHYIIADKDETIVIEHDDHGFLIYDDPYGVLTNDPSFPYHLANIRNYMHLSATNAVNRLSDKLDLKPYAEGMGAIGLPGDSSSASRYIRTIFNKFNIVSDGTEKDNVSAFFHMLDNVAMIKGCVKTKKGLDDITTYSSCINASKGYYYYKTYDNSRISMIDMHKVDLDGKDLYIYDLDRELDIKCQN